MRSSMKLFALSFAINDQTGIIDLGAMPVNPSYTELIDMLVALDRPAGLFWRQ